MNALTQQVAKTISTMVGNGASMPLVVEQGPDGSIVVMELSRHPSVAENRARWNAAEWEAGDKSRLLSALLARWDKMHTALAADFPSDPDSIMVLADCKDAFIDAANDFCDAIARRQ